MLAMRICRLSTGHAVSVPGTVAGWSDLLERHGRMTLADVLQPAIWTAEHGYPVSELIATAWQTQVIKLRRDPDWVSGDLDNGPVQPSGLRTACRRPRARSPAKSCASRPWPKPCAGSPPRARPTSITASLPTNLSDHVQRYGGWITAADMAAHASTWDEPITAEYRGVRLYECPPNGQGLAAIIAVNLASGFDLAAMDAGRPAPRDDRVHAAGLRRRPAMGLRSTRRRRSP